MDELFMNKLKIVIDVLATSILAGCAGWFVPPLLGTWPVRIVAIVLVGCAAWRYLPATKERKS